MGAFIKLLLFTIMLFLMSCNSPEKEEANEALSLSAHEHKLLLAASKFEDLDKAFVDYWEIVKSVAEGQGLKVIENKNKFKQTNRLVSFYDTKNLDLKKAGYVIRKRANITDGQLDSVFTLTIKFTSSELDLAARTKLPIGVGYTPKDAELELESDYVNGPTPESKPTVYFSVGNSVKITKVPGKTVADYSKIFSSLKSLGIDPSEEILPVNGKEAESFVVKPGSIDFGSGIIGEADISVWVVNGFIIPEFSFDHSMSNWDNNLSKSSEACEDFIKNLQINAPEWYADGKSKSSFIFN